MQVIYTGTKSSVYRKCLLFGSVNRLNVPTMHNVPDVSGQYDALTCAYTDWDYEGKSV